MAGFEPGFSGVGSDRSANSDTTNPSKFNCKKYLGFDSFNKR